MSKPDPILIEGWLKALPGAAELLFWPPPDALYSVASLYKGLDPEDPQPWRATWDTQVFNWTIGQDGRPRVLNGVETVATRLHDAAMDRLVRNFLDHDHRVTIGFMGGHDVARTSLAYSCVTKLARELRRRGFMIVTGGGPGLMEAANLGAFLAPHEDDDLEGALSLLRTAPGFGQGPDQALGNQQKRDWILTAAQVRRTLVKRWNAKPAPGGESLGIPTWYYGSEPPNLFASASGKYFMNSVREDGLVSLANGGLVYAKGASGTVQEVFQNANYNFYRGLDKTGGILDPTPMVFLGADVWTAGPRADADAQKPLDPLRKPVFPLVQALAAQAVHPFTDALLLTDSSEDILAFLSDKNEARIRPARRADQRLERVNAVARRR